MLKLLLTAIGYSIITFISAYIIAVFTTTIAPAIFKICAAIAVLGFVISFVLNWEIKRNK